MKTSLDVAMARSFPHPIPPITHEMGRHWKQPDRFSIEIDDTHALLTQKQFDDLAEYSATLPTGVYEGKMWKRHDGVYVARTQAEREACPWLLMWFGPSEHPDKCSINHRRILIV